MEGFNLIRVSEHHKPPLVLLGQSDRLLLGQLNTVERSVQSVRVLKEDCVMVRDGCFSADGKHMFVACDDKAVHVFDLNDERLPCIDSIHLLPGNRKPFFVRVSASHPQVLLSVDSAGQTFVTSLSVEGKALETKPSMGHLSPISSITFTGDGHRLMATSTRDGHLRVSHFPQSYDIHCFCFGAAGSGMITSIFGEANLSHVTSSSSDGCLKRWDVAEDGQSRLLSTLDLGGCPVILAARRADNSSILACGDLNALGVNLVSAEQESGKLQVVRHFQSPVCCTSATFLANGDLLAVGGAASAVLWVIGGGGETKNVPVDTGGAKSDSNAKRPDSSLATLLEQRKRLKRKKVTI